jgi:hypothetical protein
MKEDPIFPLESFSINGEPINDSPGVWFDHHSFEIRLRRSAAISIKTFSTRMLTRSLGGSEIDHYVFRGPNLGFYYEIGDIREPPHVHYLIDQLEVDVEHPSTEEACISVKGHSDLSRAQFLYAYDRRFTSGDWVFAATFVYRFPVYKHLFPAIDST